MRAGIYCRVSSEEQLDGYSIDAQLRACREFADARQWEVAKEYIEEGKSARTDNLERRPLFRRAMQDSAAGELDVLIVHKLDRFARNIRVTFEYFEHLSRHGVLFASVSEQGMDFTTPIGKVMLATLAAFAQYYSDNLSQEVSKGKRERKLQGLYNGLLPFGVRKGPDGIPERDPDTFPGLMLAFNQAASGKSDRQVAEMLNAAGYRTTGNMGNNPFSKDTVRGILTNRFYLGELPGRPDQRLSAKHGRLIDRDLFDQVALARARNRRQPKTVRLSARVYSLSGLLRCRECDGPMWVHQNTKGRARIYCRSRAQGLRCSNRGTFLDVYEAQLEAFLSQLVIPEDTSDGFLRSTARPVA